MAQNLPLGALSPRRSLPHGGLSLTAVSPLGALSPLISDALCPLPFPNRNPGGDLPYPLSSPRRPPTDNLRRGSLTSPLSSPRQTPTGDLPHRSDWVRGQCGSQGAPGKESLSESKLRDLLHTSEYVLTYEDKYGDWMLVGDVPWE
ncbi:hypothetical protein L6452_35638 [Arctium lappa]|uniref:Uncharacterized protein n=1 Tax=Arctium lappa TaxID=4217 RepID=A0ACB8Y731_ARCLA|nr:hypothetical protein L6452_35638 [Arctium lappa]